MSDSPIKSGWRGNINGYVEGTEASQIQITELTLKLDRDTAWALANLLTDNALNKSSAINAPQIVRLSNLGAAIGRLIDHGAANNGGRALIK